MIGFLRHGMFWTRPWSRNKSVRRQRPLRELTRSMTPFSCMPQTMDCRLHRWKREVTGRPGSRTRPRKTRQPPCPGRLRRRMIGLPDPVTRSPVRQSHPVWRWLISPQGPRAITGLGDLIATVHIVIKRESSRSSPSWIWETSRLAHGSSLAQAPGEWGADPTFVLVGKVQLSQAWRCFSNPSGINTCLGEGFGCPPFFQSSLSTEGIGWS